MPCYSGPNPVTDDERMVIWRWAKRNGIDQGSTFDKIHNDINQHFFSGQAKPEWITDILSGRKTPFREVSNAVWKQQYNRRMIVNHAKAQVNGRPAGPIMRAVQGVYNAPRRLLTTLHGFVFPVTHAGDLAFRPLSWKIFAKGMIDTYTKSGSKAATERLLSGMRGDALYDTALRSGLDVGGKSDNWITTSPKGSQASRAWDILSVMRYDLWKNQMERYAKPTMTEKETVEVGKHLAEWANHATGSGKGVLTDPRYKLGGALFGPKLTQSKLNRMIVDPVKTVHTFSNWKNATPGEKAAAWTRLSGTTQYALSGVGFLLANQAILAATGQKDKINLTDPSKSDWLNFKGGGYEWNLPGLHSEIKTLGQILAVSFANSKDVRAVSHGQTSKHNAISEQLGQYLMSKAHPAISTGVELATGHGFPNRPLPWVQEKTKTPYGAPNIPALKPIHGWDEYLLSHGPIFLEGPVKYVYDQLRKRGASALDSTTFIKSLILESVGFTGVHIKPSSEDVAAAAKRQKVATALLRR